MILTDTQIEDAFGALFPHWATDGMDMHTQVQPSSVDLRLGDTIRVPRLGDQGFRCLGVEEDDSELWRTVDISEGYPLYPGHEHFILAHTVEVVAVPETLTARVDGRSSLGRRGLRVHSTAGYIDPGFVGQITLEMDVVGVNGVLLRPGMRICQVSFIRNDGPVRRPYGSVRDSKYQHQYGATTSRSHRERR